MVTDGVSTLLCQLAIENHTDTVKLITCGKLFACKDGRSSPVYITLQWFTLTQYANLHE